MDMCRSTLFRWQDDLTRLCDFQSDEVSVRLSVGRLNAGCYLSNVSKDLIANIASYCESGLPELG